MLNVSFSGIVSMHLTLQTLNGGPFGKINLLRMDSEMIWYILKFPNCNRLYLTGKALESADWVSFTWLLSQVKPIAIWELQYVPNHFRIHLRCPKKGTNYLEFLSFLSQRRYKSTWGVNMMANEGFFSQPNIGAICMYTDTDTCSHIWLVIQFSLDSLLPNLHL